MQVTSFTFSTLGMTRQASDSSDPSNASVLALTDGERRFLAALVELGVPFLVLGVGSAALQDARDEPRAQRRFSMSFSMTVEREPGGSGSAASALGAGGVGSGSLAGAGADV